MAWPMVGGIAATMAFNIVDTFFIGKLGANELAAMGFVNPVVMAIVSASVGMSMGTSSALSRAIGQGKSSLMRAIASNSLVLSGIVSLFLTIVGLLFNDALFQILGASPADLELIREYMQIWWVGIFFVIVPMVSLGQIRAMGRTGLQSRIMIYASILNAILDPVFIMGFYFIPAMGLQGAALATLLTRSFTFFAALYYLKYEFELLYFSRQLLNRFTMDCRNILYVALPATFTNLITPFATGVVTAMVAAHGTHAVAALNIALNIEAICRITFFALAAAIAPFMGQNMGARAYDRMRTASNYCYYSCMIWGVFLTLTLSVFAPQVAGFFTDASQVIQITTTYIYVISISYGCFGLVRITTAGLNGMGRPLPGTSISFTRAILLQIPLAMLGGFYWGLMGIFCAISLSNILSSALAYYWNKRILQNLDE